MRTGTSDKILTSTGKRIRALRDGKGWNQARFVEVLENFGSIIGRSSMSQIENDINNPSQDLLINIAKSLNTTTDYLLLLSDDPFPPQTTDTQIVIETKGNEERKVIEEIFELIQDYPLDEQRRILDMLRFVVKEKKPRIIGE